MCWHGLVLRTMHIPHALCQEVCKEEANCSAAVIGFLLVWLQRLAEAALGTPAAAMGVLHHIGAAISRRSYWRETYRVLAAPAYLGLLSIIVARHPLMHAEVDTLLLASASCCSAHILIMSRSLHVLPPAGGERQPCQMQESASVTSTFC